MPKFLWFHAYYRQTVEEMIDVLVHGAEPTPPGLSKTRMNETRLGLQSASYVYLGRAHDDFGYAAFALPESAFTGTMSPFDTGGLVERLDPVAGWTDAKKSKYVAAYSWNTTDYDPLTGEYPGADPALVTSYVAMDKPPHSGPHVLWPKRPKADIWLLNNDWRAWTWEGRCNGPISTGPRILHWTCPPDVFERMQLRIEAGGSDFDLLVALTSRYVRGGVSAMLEKLRSSQAGGS